MAFIAASILSAMAENTGVADGLFTREVMTLTQSAHRASPALGILLTIFAGSRVRQQQASNMRNKSLLV